MKLSGIQVAKVWGIPIKVHFSLLILLPFIAFRFSPMIGNDFIAWILGLTLAVGLFFCIALHELGHSLVALKMNCRVREILLLPIGGAAQLERIPSLPWQELVMAIAGPAVSMLLGVICLLAAFSMGNTYAGKALEIMGKINIILAVFNLIPSFPMDGGRVFRALLTPKLGRLRATRWAANIGKMIAVIFGLIGATQPYNLFLIAIAFFLYSTASGEYRMVQIEEERKKMREKGDQDFISISHAPIDENENQPGCHNCEP